MTHPKSPKMQLSFLFAMFIAFASPAFSTSTSFSLLLPSQTFATDEPTQVSFQGFPSTTDWITIVKVGTPDDEDGDWFYTDGLKAGTLTFQPHSAGKYEFRAYCCWLPGQ
ncbi:MAG: hypothetical protein GY822_10900 [Deltaproteobacteria bacterium]|nr:hypothetical protein [Deltaproteobacteria bacterium]